MYILYLLNIKAPLLVVKKVGSLEWSLEPPMGRNGQEVDEHFQTRSPL